jgi:DNA-binding MarR family transcriptional regulator
MVPLQRNLFYRVARLNMLLGRRVTSAYGPEGITSHQWKIMSVVYHFEPIQASEIAAYVTFDQPAISRAVRQLQDHGFIRRTLHESDGRAVHITLSATGRRVFERIGEQVTQAQNELLAGIASKDYALILHLFDQIETRLGTREAGAGTADKHDLARG